MRRKRRRSRQPRHAGGEIAYLPRNMSQTTHVQDRAATCRRCWRSDPTASRMASKGSATSEEWPNKAREGASPFGALCQTASFDISRFVYYATVGKSPFNEIFELCEHRA